MKLFELPGALHGRLGVITKAGVNHQIGAGPNTFSRLSHQGQISGLVSSQRSPAKLDCCEPAPNEAFASLTGLFAFFGNKWLSDHFGINVPWLWLALLMLAVIAVLAYRDVKLSAKILGVALMAEVAMLTIFSLGVIFAGSGAHFSMPNNGPASPFDFNNGDAITLEAWVNIAELGDGIGGKSCASVAFDKSSSCLENHVDSVAPARLRRNSSHPVNALPPAPHLSAPLSVNRVTQCRLPS
jgi:hypothetical protein